MLTGVTRGETLDKAAEEAAKKLFDPQAIGGELRLQGEYVGIDGEKRIGVQVVARKDKSFHALVLEGGLPGDGWDGQRYGLLESAPGAEGRVEFGSPSEAGVSAVLDERGVLLKRGGHEALLKRVERRSKVFVRRTTPARRQGAVALCSRVLFYPSHALPDFLRAARCPERPSTTRGSLPLSHAPAATPQGSAPPAV